MYFCCMWYFSIICLTSLLWYHLYLVPLQCFNTIFCWYGIFELPWIPREWIIQNKYITVLNQWLIIYSTGLDNGYKEISFVIIQVFGWSRCISHNCIVLELRNLLKLNSQVLNRRFLVPPRVTTVWLARISEMRSSVTSARTSRSGYSAVKFIFGSVAA